MTPTTNPVVERKKRVGGLVYGLGLRVRDLIGDNPDFERQKTLNPKPTKEHRLEDLALLLRHTDAFKLLRAAE